MNKLLLSLSILFIVVAISFLLSNIYIRNKFKENFISKVNKENIQSILKTTGLSYSDQINKIKSLNVNDQTLNDLIFNNEKTTIRLITEYMMTNIPEGPKS
jgi:hypothetical protein